MLKSTLEKHGDRPTEITAKAKKVLENRGERGERIEMNEFRELYGNENVDNDLKYIKEKEEQFKKEQESHPHLKLKETVEITDALETILFENIELQNWLGENSSIIKTSRYDDIKNGVDGVLEFYLREESALSHLALGVDVAFSRDFSKKIKRARSEIEAAKLAEIKYFISEQKDFKGKLENIPRVVIAIDPKTVSELFDLWISIRSSRKAMTNPYFSEETKREMGKKLRREIKKLAKHRLQFIILGQIRIQLGKYAEFTRKIGKPEIEEKIQKRLSIINSIIESKKIEKQDFAKEESIIKLTEELEHYFKV